MEGVGADSIHSDSTRQAMSESIAACGAALGGGPSGRVWFSGEPAAADALRQRIERELGWECRVPDFRDRYELTASGARSARR